MDNGDILLAVMNNDNVRALVRTCSYPLSTPADKILFWGVLSHLAVMKLSEAAGTVCGGVSCAALDSRGEQCYRCLHIDRKNNNNNNKTSPQTSTPHIQIILLDEVVSSYICVFLLFFEKGLTAGP